MASSGESLGFGCLIRSDHGSFAMQFYNPGPISRWRLLFVVMGCWSCLVGITGLIFLADSPVKAWWLVSLAV